MLKSVPVYYEDLAHPGTILPDFEKMQDGVNLTAQGRTDLYRIALRGALALVRPSIGIKQTKTPVISVQRNQAELIASLENEILYCTKENVVASGLSDGHNWLYGYLNFMALMQGKI
jgi:hypothetical protein